jgi:hypothetical protein
MQRRIYKYPICIVDSQIIPMTQGARILSVQMQGETPCLWVMVDVDNSAIENKHIDIYGTGHPLKDTPSLYIGTIQEHIPSVPYISLVWHVFERLM